MVRLSESVGHEELDRFIEIIHVDADHRVLSVTVRDVYMKAVFVLHTYVRGIDLADILFDMVPLKTEILKNLEANDIDVNAPKVVRKPRRKLSELPGQMTFF